ncbi:capsid protein [Tupanvirus deep ocean]|uniref:Capsid protein n=2 Tax=Tupanvirus TaxID=2094720 RepID=A0AC62A8X5_9VIRU|nr:capsid protein [Tupanvirus deep ocean]QKU34110.1 capsid protein [Tupanvirus deep ocean]
MAGGLVQLATYGTQDVFLTGNPQITFFKIVYRRHTNFSMESIQQHFIGVSNFGQEMTSVIEKLGDLMNRVYLEIEIPKVDLVKNFSNWENTKENAKQQLEKIEKFYQSTYNYISANTDIAKKLDILLNTNNISIDDIAKTLNDQYFTNNLSNKKNQLIEYITNNNDLESFKGFENVNRSDLVQQVNQIDIQILSNSVIHNIDKHYKISVEEAASLKRQFIKNIINKKLYKAMYDFYIKIYNAYFTAQKKYQSFLETSYTERYKFAWVEELGHAIIDYVEIKIGNQTIDKHSGDWLILFNKIFLQEYQIENYYKMIGNITELTIFDDSVKNSYKLIIPFQFWFCRNTGLALPLVSLRYHDIMFTIKLKDLSKLCYVEDNPSLMDLPNIQSQYNINIVDAKLYVDYVYLDTDERRRFAQSSHEYLIETVQYNEFNDIQSKQYNAHMNFSHPTKFIIWYAQPNFYRENPTGRNKCQWNNFGVYPDKTGYTMESAYLRLNSYNRTDPDAEIKFYNYVHPYLYFAHSPTDGFNVYSFAIKPMEHQPSSTINLSRIDDFGLVLIFTDEFMDLVRNSNIDDIEIGIYVGVYVMTYNILRIMSGMAGVAFQNST